MKETIAMPSLGMLNLIAGVLLTIVGTYTIQAEEAEPLQVKVRSVLAGKKFSVYIGSGPGPAIKPPYLGGFVQPDLVAVQGGRISSAIMMVAEDGENYGYYAGTVEATNADIVVLQVQCDVRNLSQRDQPFRPLDIGISVSKRYKGYFRGVGVGEIAFGKEEAVWDKVRKSKPEIILPGESDLYTYIFLVSKDSPYWTLTYKGRNVAELKGTEKFVE